jgi:hypothetical protein
MKKHCLVFVLVLDMLVILSVTPAHAYIDPGSGSMLLQLLLGGVAGLLLALKIFWRSILSFFHIKSADKKETPGKDKP